MYKNKFMRLAGFLKKVLVKTVMFLVPLAVKGGKFLRVSMVALYKAVRRNVPVYTERIEKIYDRISLKITALVVLVSINIILFYKLLWAYFGMEDPMMIADSIIADVPGKFGLIFERLHNEFSRYFRNAINYVFYKLWGVNAWPHYAYAIVSHSLITCLVYIFVTKLTKERRAGFLSAVVFAVLQVNSEVMHWYAAGSMYLPMVLFFIVSFLLFIKYQDGKKFTLLFLAVLFYALAILSNQAAVTLVAVLFLYDLLFCANFGFKKTGFKKTILYLLKTYPVLIIVTYLFMHFIQKSAVVVSPRGFVNNFVLVNARILPHMFFPVPLMMKISDFLRAHGLAVLSANAYLHYIISFILISLAVPAFFIYRNKKYNINPGLLIFSLLGIYITYAPFSFLSLSGYNTAEAVSYVMMRYYFLPSIFGMLFLSLLFYALYLAANKYIRFVFILGLASLLMYSFVLKKTAINSTARWTAFGRQIMEEIKAYYPVFPDRSIICVRDAEGEDHPAIGSRHFKELMLLYYASPHNPLHAEELKEFNLEISDSFNRNRDLYLYLTNISDIYIGCKPHIWGKRIFDHPYLNRTLSAYERVLLGLRKGFFDVDQVYVFDYKLDGKPVIKDVTREVRKELREYAATVREVQPVVENFNDAEDLVFSAGAGTGAMLSSGVMNIKTAQKFNSQLKVFELNIPCLASSDLSLTRMLPYNVEIRMKIEPQKADTVSFPYMQNQTLSEKEFSIEQLKEKLNRDKNAVMRNYRFLFDIQSSVSSYYKGHPYYSIWGLVDGRYGDEHAWIGAAESGYYPPNWIKIDLREILEVKGIRWSRDRTGQANNTINDYNIQVSVDDKNWFKVTEVKGLRDEKGLLKTDEFKPVKARYVKMEITDTEGTTISSPPCIDEFEILLAGDRYDYTGHAKIIEDYNDRFEAVRDKEQLQLLYKSDMPLKAYWIFSDDEEWNEQKSEEFYAAADGQFHTYRIFIPSSGKLYDRETLKQIKICLAQVPSEIEVDYVKVLPLEDDEFHLINRYGDIFVQLHDLQVYKEELFACGSYPIGTAKIFSYSDGNWQQLFSPCMQRQRDQISLELFKNKLFASQESWSDSGVISFDDAAWNKEFELPEKKALSLAVLNDNLYLATAYQGKIIAFDGTEYKEVYVCEGAKTHVFCLIAYNNKLYASISGGRIISFDGKEWKEVSLKDENGVYVQNFEVYDGKLYAGTNNGKVLVFDGTRWTEAFVSQEDGIMSLVVFRDKLYAGTKPSAKIFCYDQKRWQEVYNAPQESIAVLGVYENKLIAVSFPGGMVYTYDPENALCPWTVTSIIR